MHEINQISSCGEDRGVKLQVARSLGHIGRRERRDGPIGLVQLVGGWQAQLGWSELEALGDRLQQLFGSATAKMAPVETPGTPKIVACARRVLGDRQHGEIGQNKTHREVDSLSPPLTPSCDALGDPAGGASKLA